MPVIRNSNVLPGAGHRVYEHEIEVSHAEILDLVSTPAEIVPAPGPGRTIIPVSAVVRKFTGSTVYAITSASVVQFKIGTNAVINVHTDVFTGSTASRFHEGFVLGNNGGDSSTEIAANTSVTLEMAGSNDLTGGDDDQSAFVRFRYLIAED